MKKLVGILVAIVLSTASMAQAPQAFAFQSSISDTLGNPLSNQGISVQFEVHQSSAVGAVVYSETQSVTTSASGYFSANVGQGSVVTGSFPGISWGTDTYWLEVSVDTTGGSSYVSLGASQLLSVPYALSAGNVNTPSVFYAGQVAGAASGPMDTVVTVVNINRGGAYNAVTGVFTVTVAGIYEIAASNGDFMGVTNYYINGVNVATGPGYNEYVELNIGDTFHMEADSYDANTQMRVREIK